MSLLDGRHEIFVETSGEVVTDSLGVKHVLQSQWELVSGIVQWDRIQESGQVFPEPGSTVTVIAREWPGRPNGHFRWGRNEFEQVGPAKTFDGSPYTRHVEVSARWIGEHDGVANS